MSVKETIEKIKALPDDEFLRTPNPVNRHHIYSRDLVELVERLKRVEEAVRYALATFRALDQYTFEDSDHGLLIAQAVKKLEEAALSGRDATEVESKGEN